MRFAARFFSVLAVALLAAQPVMACCLTGHAQPAATEMSADMPCHDAINSGPDHKDAAGPSTENQNGPDCPGCPDCNASTMQAQPSADETYQSKSAADFEFAAIEIRFTGFVPRSLVQATGPPRNWSLPVISPITLKQRLLI